MIFNKNIYWKTKINWILAVIDIFIEELNNLTSASYKDIFDINVA